MTLEEAMDLVINEAESSALGEGNEEVMDAVKMVKCFLKSKKNSVPWAWTLEDSGYLRRKEYNYIKKKKKH
jgi:hypothetical protein